jgi:acetate---CoA ligase (ADP-forming)
LSLRGAALLTGFRGRPPVDIARAASFIARLSALAAEHPDVSEIECNPLAVSPGAVLALDARVVLENGPVRPPGRRERRQTQGGNPCSPSR